MNAPMTLQQKAAMAQLEQKARLEQANKTAALMHLRLIQLQLAKAPVK